ncbi:MAG: small nuclear ribonucleoprotein [Candidatus Diapherotrites archaeon]|nr:small nuclear ribonucleoprotein [Candidatus Diapherotrites archaeon]
MVKRPFDLLNEAIGREVLVQLKNGMQIRGTLLAFDAHMNLTLDGAEEIEGVETKRKLGKILIRGDTVIFVSPSL